MSTQNKENNTELESNPLKQRIKKLMTEKELEAPYSFAKRVGLSKGTFTGIWIEGRKSLHKSTLDKICEATGANPAWLATGVGEVFSFESKSNREPITNTQLDAKLLIQAFNALESSLVSANKEMPPKGRSRFISALYQALKQTDDSTNIEVLADCIYTIEEALNLKRQIMSSEAKTRLILAVYELYIYNPAYKDVMQSTITQLVGTLYD